MVYLFSDGFQDQFGGPEGKKYMIKNLKELLLRIHQLPMEEQKHLLEQELLTWQGDQHKQVDDILVVGFRI
jgi:serine phosphatase RsbU (regulator of sigma subunit)